MTDLIFDTTASADVYSQTIDKCDVVADEFRFNADHDGLHFAVVDPSNVAMVRLDVTPDAFNAYASDDFEMGIATGRLLDVLDLADSGELVDVNISGETHKFEVSGDGFDFDIAGIDPDSVRQEPDLPDLDLPCSVDIDTSQLSRAIRGCDMVSDHIALGYDPETEEVTAEATGDTDDAYFAWGDEQVEISDRPSDTVESLLSLDFLQDLITAFHSDAPINLRFGHEMPIRMYQPFLDGAGECEMMLAPRISSEG